MIHYITSSKNGFALAGSLQHFKIPYDYNPYRKFGKKKVRNGYGKDVWEFDLCTESDTIVKTKSGRSIRALFRIRMLCQCRAHHRRE